MKTTQLLLLVIVLAAVGAIIGVKTWSGMSATTPTPQPANTAAVAVGVGPGTLLLFNRNMGCQCVMKLYAAADSYFNKLDPEVAAAFHAQRINADESPELVEAHGVIVAPTIIILDEEGNEVLRQESRITIDDINAKLHEILAQEGEL
ncbi:MAG TPA: hypothetical protein DCM67_08670 [Propionibacteriaceae bacterium]|nr:hypothetical protein [Propionibacteriaceae bacterium]